MLVPFFHNALKHLWFLGEPPKYFMTDLFSKKVDNIVISVPDVSKDPNDWLITKEEAYVPDKDVFVYEAFKKDYPDLITGVTIYNEPDNKGGFNYEKSASKIYALASRSTTLNVWLSKINLDYSRSAQLPQFFKDKVTPNEYQTIQKDLASLNDIEKTRATKLNELAANYKKAVNDLNARMDAERNLLTDKATTKTALTIVNLNSTRLPLTLQLAIENYTPASTSSLVSRRAYAREVLVNYKRSLFDIAKANPNLSINDLIDKLSPK